MPHVTVHSNSINVLCYVSQCGHYQSTHREKISVPCVFCVTYHSASMYLFRLWPILIGCYQSTHTEEISVPRVTVHPNRTNILCHVSQCVHVSFQVVADFDRTLSKYTHTEEISVPRVKVHPNRTNILCHVSQCVHVSFQIVADFDRTLSKYTHSGNICAMCQSTS